MRRQALLPDLRTLSASRGFWSAAPARAYTAAGSFLRCLQETQGTARFQRLLAHGDFAGAYGRSLEELVGGWERMLDALPLDESAVNRAFARFRAPSLFRRPCVREVADLRDEARAVSKEQPGAGPAPPPALRCAPARRTGPPARRGHPAPPARSPARGRRGARPGSEPSSPAVHHSRRRWRSPGPTSPGPTTTPRPPARRWSRPLAPPRSGPGASGGGEARRPGRRADRLRCSGPSSTPAPTSCGSTSWSARGDALPRTRWSATSSADAS